MNNLFLKKARFVLYPASVVYGAALRVRHWLFDKNVFKSSKFNLPVICVGNLALGGTGKTPTTEYLIKLLKGKYKIATLSRGYKRRTKGYTKAAQGVTALEIGDEPMQFFEKFPDVVVAVAEERAVGIPQILFDHPETEVIILDDALQHRWVVAGMNILLTAYSNLYSADFLFPAGNLRDTRNRSEAADIIIVNQCPQNLTEEEKKKVINELNILPAQKLFFSTYAYGDPVHLFDKRTIKLNESGSVLLITGIANPTNFKNYVGTLVDQYELITYPDHHIFNTDDLREIQSSFSAIDDENKIILTTEKDGVRLQKFEKGLRHLPIYTLPLHLEFLFGEGDSFNKEILDFVQNFSENNKA